MLDIGRKAHRDKSSQDRHIYVTTDQNISLCLFEYTCRILASVMTILYSQPTAVKKKKSLFLFDYSYTFHLMQKVCEVSEHLDI